MIFLDSWLKIVSLFDQDEVRKSYNNIRFKCYLKYFDRNKWTNVHTCILATVELYNIAEFSVA